MLLGETAVGKSSIVQRYVRDQFLENQESTIGGRSDVDNLIVLAAFLSQTIKIDNDIIKVAFKFITFKAVIPKNAVGVAINRHAVAGMT